MRTSSRLSLFLVVAGLLVFLGLFQQTSRLRPIWTSQSDYHVVVREHAEVTLVVASQTSDDTAWLQNKFLKWNHAIYVTNSRRARLTVAHNKGRENMVYLTHIIDNYDTLTDVTIFQHANKYQWHNDDPLYDGERMLDRLQISYIKEQGYVNLRCVWTLGCPSEIYPIAEENSTEAEAEDARAGSFYKQAFEVLFPDMPVPKKVGVSCCAQFAVSAEKIRERPRSDYERYRKWLLETPLADYLSGRIMEYSWHIVFGQKAIFCPTAPACYCGLYGLCNLSCESEGTCESQYTLPQYSDMPEGWPDIDLAGEWRNITKLRQKQALDYTGA